MGKRRIHIDNLSIRLPQSARQDARAVVARIGREILTRTAEATRDRTGASRLDGLSKRISTSDPQGVGATVSRSIAAEIAKRLGDGGR